MGITHSVVKIMCGSIVLNNLILENRWEKSNGYLYLNLNDHMSEQKKWLSLNSSRFVVLYFKLNSMPVLNELGTYFPKIE